MWIMRRHGVNVQKDALFQLVSFLNPDSFSGKNSNLCLPLGFPQTKSSQLLTGNESNQLSTVTCSFIHFHRFLTSYALCHYFKLASYSGLCLLFSHTWFRQANYSLCGSQGESLQPATHPLVYGQHGSVVSEAAYTRVTWHTIKYTTLTRQARLPVHNDASLSCFTPTSN